MNPEISRSRLFLETQNYLYPQYDRKAIVSALTRPNGLTAEVKGNIFSYQFTPEPAFGTFKRAYLKIFNPEGVEIGLVTTLRNKNDRRFQIGKMYTPHLKTTYEGSGAIGLGQSLLVQAMIGLYKIKMVTGEILQTNVRSIQSRLLMQDIILPTLDFYQSALIPLRNFSGEAAYQCYTFIADNHRRTPYPYSIEDALELGSHLNIFSLPFL